MSQTMSCGDNGKSRVTANPWGAIFNSGPLQAESNKSCRRARSPKHFSTGQAVVQNWNQSFERIELRQAHKKLESMQEGNGARGGPVRTRPFWPWAALRLFLGHGGAVVSYDLWPVVSYCALPVCMFCLSGCIHSPIPPSCRAMLAVLGASNLRVCSLLNWASLPSVAAEACGPEVCCSWRAVASHEIPRLGRFPSSDPLRLTQSVSMSEARRAWCPS